MPQLNDELVEILEKNKKLDRPTAEERAEASAMVRARIKAFPSFAREWVASEDSAEIPALDVCDHSEATRYILPTDDVVQYQMVEPEQFKLRSHQKFCQYLRSEGLIVFVRKDEDTKRVWIMARVNNFNDSDNRLSDSVAEDFTGA